MPMSPSPQPRSRAPSSPPVSHVVSRGSAPPGLFDIPDHGLHIPHPKSFLARFQARLTAPARPSPPPPSPPPAPDSPEVKPVHSPPQPPLPQHVDPKHIPIQLNPQTPPAPAPQPAPVPAPNSEVQPEPAPESTKPVSLPRHSARHSAAPLSAAALEAAADDAEDVLINVVPNSPSLLSESRPSYPILRFCAANALLDQHALDTLSLPLAFAWAPFAPAPQVPRLPRTPSRCATCGSFFAPANGLSPARSDALPTWTCVFCGRDDNQAALPPSPHPDTSPDQPPSLPELDLDAVEYLHPEGAARSAAGRGAIVLIVDDNLAPDEASCARAAAAAVHAAAAESGLRFALLTVGAGAAVAAQYKNDDQSVPILEHIGQKRAATLLPEEKERFFLPPPSPESSGNSSIQDQDDAATYIAYTDVFITHRSSPTFDVDDHIYEEGLEEDSAAEPLVTQKTRLEPEEETRRLDVAISVALELITGMADSENSRILCLLTGPPTLPPYFVDDGREGRLSKASMSDAEAANAALTNLYEHVGTRAGDLRIALDFLCFGAPNGFAGSVLLAAAKRSRGGLVYSAAHSFSAPSALAEAATFLSQRSTRPGVVSIRVSSPLTVARVIGPAFPTAAPQTYAVPGIDPTIGFTVVLKLKQGIEEETDLPSHAVVQLAAKSLESTRVISVRIPLTKSGPEYLSSLDPEICALVLGKACVVSGGALTQPHIAARSIDVSVRRLLRGSEASAGIVRLLYELRRGLLIEKQVEPDCALVLRSFFLRAECSIASLLMSPRLFTNVMSDESTGLMAEVPLEKSYITKEAVLVLDTGFNVFVYVGEGASPEAEEAISESARSVAAQRYSPCQLWKLRPGRDANYLLDSYLSPSEPPKGAIPPSPTEQGFIQYCKSLAPDSMTVRLLQNT